METSRAATRALIGIALALAAPVRAGDRGFDASPDGRAVAFSADDGDLYTLELATLRVRRLARTEEDEGSPAYSPDGKSLAYAGSMPGRAGSRIAIRPIDGGDARTLAGAEGACDIWPAFSPDGRAVAFVRAARLRPASMGGERWTDFDIRSVGVDGTGDRPLTRKAYWAAESPRFTRDGKSVVFAAAFNEYPAKSHPLLLEVDAGGAGELRAIGPKPGPAHERVGAWASTPTAAPDSDLLAFVSDRDRPYAYDLLTMGRDGTGARALGIAKAARSPRRPVLLRGGRGILFLAVTPEEQGYGLWRVGLDGKGLRRLAGPRLFADPMNWKPGP